LVNFRGFSGKKYRVVYWLMMINRLTLVPYVLLTWATILNAGAACASTVEAVLAHGDNSIVGPSLPPTPVQGGGLWNGSRRAGWENRIFDNPLSHYNFSKSQGRSTNGSGFSLKAPGMLPGIAFDIEMHSLGALQSIVPPERWSKSWNAQQEEPLLLSPSHISPDYTGGFLRFTW
jgi:hypothetical protein